RPMETGDGLVVRIRPHGSRLTAEQARALAGLAVAHGNGLIDLGSRAHVQVRGVRADGLPALHAALAGLGLLDPDPHAEARRNILTTPVWQGDETPRLVAALEAALHAAPDLPPKFGFAVDTGRVAVLGTASADIRIERGTGGGLILRADGMAAGEPVTTATAAPRAVGLAHWFAAHRDQETRMARLLATGAAPPRAATEAPERGAPLLPGPGAGGLCLALPFGRMRAETLHALAVAPLRLTPWRSVVVEGIASLPVPDDLIADPDDPLLRVAACTGAPGCASASVATRDIARSLAPLVPAGCTLHVAGCAKGCAHSGAADVTLTGRDGRFDLILNGPAGGTPVARGLNPDTLSDLLRGHLAPRP
ncbi:MAG: hypothetical protein QM656_17810, partial [Paracoccaceae bacterium]